MVSKPIKEFVPTLATEVKQYYPAGWMQSIGNGAVIPLNCVEEKESKPH